MIQSVAGASTWFVGQVESGPGIEHRLHSVSRITMREGEAEQVVGRFKELGVDIEVVDNGTGIKQDLIEKVEILQKKVDDIKWKIPTISECVNCEYWQKHECQGGCSVYKFVK